MGEITVKDLRELTIYRLLYNDYESESLFGMYCDANEEIGKYENFEIYEDFKDYLERECCALLECGYLDSVQNRILENVKYNHYYLD